MKLKPSESDVQKAIYQWLELNRYFCWRNNTGARKFDYRRKDGKVTHNFFQWGKPGSGDIIGLMKDGRFFSIEVKAPGKKPTELQLAFMESVRKSNGVAFVAQSLDDVMREFKLYETQSVVVSKTQTQSVVFTAQNGQLLPCVSTTA